MALVQHLLTFDALFALILGFLLYFVPWKVGDVLFQRTTDGVHWHLIRCIGGQVLASALVSFQFRKSSTISQSVCHLIRLIPAIFIVVLVLQIQSLTPNLINGTILKLVKYGLISTIITQFFLLTKAGWKTGTRLVPSNVFGNFLYQLDALASICIGTVWMTFPKWLLHRQVLIGLDESHEFLGRVMGANFIASYIVSTHALHWESHEDRYVAVDSRVICCLAILCGQLWSQTYQHWSGNHWVGICLFSTWTLISIAYRTYLTVSRKNHQD